MDKAISLALAASFCTATSSICQRLGARNAIGPGAAGVDIWLIFRLARRPIWLAGLAGISPELREAAHIDGANAVRTFWHIELPQLRGTAVLIAALSTINAFQTFTLQYVLSPDPGGPANSTLVLGLLVLKYGFQYFRMGDAAAVSVVMFGMILAVTAAQLWFNRRSA